MSHGFPNDQRKIHAFKIYVTSYVSKWKDAYNNDALYSPHTTPYQAAYRHIREMEPCEPEMWFQLTSMKCSWTNSRTKEYVVSLPQALETNRVHHKYTKRPNAIEDMSFLQWLTHVDHSKADPVPYKAANTLVSVKMVSPFKRPIFFPTFINEFSASTNFRTFSRARS